MKIYTLTLNPAFDVYADADTLSVSRENFAELVRRDAGGKGVNISRALSAWGTENTAVVVLGKENGISYQSSLAQYGLNAVYLEREGSIRENLTIRHEGTETRISFSGFRVDETVLQDVLKLIDIEEETIVTFTGSIPLGLDKTAVISFLRSLKEKGVKLVIDCRSFTLEDISVLKPWLVKPNLQELAAWFDCEVSSVAKVKECAVKLRAMGVENAMISMGAQGAVLACDEIYAGIPPKIKPVSTIGAGDSSIAGFISAAADGLSAADRLRRAVAFGTAACMTEGTQPPRKEDIDRIVKDVLS